MRETGLYRIRLNIPGISVSDSGLSGEAEECHLFGVAVSHKEGHLIPPTGSRTCPPACVRPESLGTGARPVAKTIIGNRMRRSVASDSTT